MYHVSRYPAVTRVLVRVATEIYRLVLLVHKCLHRPYLPSPRWRRRLLPGARDLSDAVLELREPTERAVGAANGHLRVLDSIRA